MVNNGYREAPYEKLQFYKNICYIRKRIYAITRPLEKSHLKIINQTRDAARSAKQNIIEGYQKDSIGTFIQHIKITKGSLGEALGDLKDLQEDGLISRKDFEEIDGIGRKTDYMISRYIDSLYRMKKEKTWKTRFK